MSTNTNKYSTNIQSREFFVAPVEALTQKINTELFKYDTLDEEGTVVSSDYHTVKSYVQANGRKLMYTADGLYFYLGLDTSDLNNDTRDLKSFLVGLGYELGGTAFDDNGTTFVWVLGANDLDKWLEATPHNVVEADEEDIIDG